MGNYLPGVDQNILKAQPFAKPVLEHLRALVHRVCPEVEEKLKWGMPFFDYRGKSLASMMSFKEHCAFGFWYHVLLTDPDNVLARAQEGGMGSFGKIRSLEDLPDDKQIAAFILESMEFIEKGVKLPKKDEAAKKALETPPVLAEALKKDRIAADVFEKFSYSHRKEYIEWINEAKTEPTRLRRLETTMQNLREGKSKEWKYK